MSQSSTLATTPQELSQVRIKGKVEQSRERSSTLPVHLGVVAIEKGAFWSSSTKGRQLYFLLTYFKIFQKKLIILVHNASSNKRFNIATNPIKYKANEIKIKETLVKINV